MRKTRKTVAMAASLALVAVLSVSATLAWLTDETEEVKNTFTVAKLFENPDVQFTLWEHEAVDENEDGRYELTDEEVTGNTYGVLPGVNIPKDPTVDIVNLEANAYLYVKVTNNLSAGLTYSMDSSNWEQLAGYDGIWVYKGQNATNNVISASIDAKKSFTVNVLTQNADSANGAYAITVPSTYTGTADAGTLAFEAYIAQATGNGANAAEAWANTFGGS